jgi:predicted nucleotidyltransferase
MGLRSIPAAMDAGKVARIDAAVDGIVREHGVAIGLAVESGSRAWGFPSPDSDYDCRFVYIRPLAHYLTPWPRRDVIELPLVDELDINGWDLAKSLKLLMKGNAVIIEWLTSPLVYRGDEEFFSSFLALAHAVADRNLVIRHYLHLSEEFRRRHLSDPAAVPLKKLFYALRPAAAIRWLARHSEAAVAPMHFPTLMAESELPPDVATIVADLLACKATTRELGTGPLPRPLATFIDGELEWARANTARRGPSQRREQHAMCETFFAETVRRYETDPALAGRGR